MTVEQMIELAIATIPKIIQAGNDIAPFVRKFAALVAGADVSAADIEELRALEKPLRDELYDETLDVWS